jgi:hypothetical protein
VATSTITEAPQDQTETTESPSPHRRRRKAFVSGVVLVALAGVVVAVLDPFSGPRPAKLGVTDNADPTSLTAVAQRSLSSQIEVNATLGYAGSYTVVVPATGATSTAGSSQARGGGSSAASSSSATFTALPTVGQVVSQGQTVYAVDGSSVVLLYGSTPAYRTLSEGMTGSDVTELNADLVALGYASSSQLSPTSDYFSSETANALEKLQAALGVDQTGILTLGQAVFLPSSIRVTDVGATLGAPAQTGATMLSGTSTARQVAIDLDASQQSEVKVGDKVTITLPDEQTTPGVVSSVGTVATIPSSSSGSGSGSSAESSPGSGSAGSAAPTITVDVTPSDPAATGNLDQAPVNVTITTATVNQALVVPVDALLAVSGGGYALEVVGTDNIHRLVTVTLGLFDDADGLVQVIGSGLSAGQRVVVPAL